MDTPLPCEVRCGSVVFSKGVALRTFVEAAARWKVLADAHVTAGMAKPHEAALRFPVSALGDEPLCGCHRCVDVRIAALPSDAPRMHGPNIPGWTYACDICGNKRCPHHTDHRLACTGSNASGQAGSDYA